MHVTWKFLFLGQYIETIYPENGNGIVCDLWILDSKKFGELLDNLSLTLEYYRSNTIYIVLIKLFQIFFSGKFLTCAFNVDN